MKIIWELPPEPGPEVTAISVDGDTYTFRAPGEEDKSDAWVSDRGSEWTWSELVVTAADMGIPILDVTP